jgi:GDPmannose 4,6-dehydratase
MYGNFAGDLNECTIMNPVSPYGTSKLFAHNICKNYRDSYGMHISNGILFNHESPRRGETFITRKITKAVALIRAERAQYVTIGNPNAKRDWGHAKEYVQAMWLMLQQENPDDYVIATGEEHSVAEVANIAFGQIGINLEWNNIGAVDKNGVYRVKLDDRYRRPNELHFLRGDPRKATRVLGWKAKTSFEELIREMVEHDIKEVNSECPPPLSTEQPGS